ncbi:medium-chain acyl-CoA ligase ACSF2, mitochondrial-like isoform X2 [Armigeres subalbatus]|uniref:medium-chain acyl-CoA ligase ACSF2, mitochondrial-like isoform X2 n=1 Tax=Armigeres subalbatus TaxID=124917 RepID=UPI002ED5D87F
MLRIPSTKLCLAGGIRTFHTSKPLACSSSPAPPITNERNQSYIHHIGKDPLVYRNVGQHLRLAAEKYPNNEALVSCHENKRFTYSEALEKADRIAASFYQLGLKKGDRVGIWAPNGSQFYLSSLAAARAGMISVGINPAFQAPEAEYALNKGGVRALILAEQHYSTSYYDLTKQIIPELTSSSPGKLRSARVPTLETVIVDTADAVPLPGTMLYKDMLQLPTEQHISEIESLQMSISPESGLNMQFTSGTTGLPKAATVTHNGFVNNAIHLAYRNEFNLKHHRICLQLPLFHAFAMVVGVLTAFTYGTTIVVPGARYKPMESLDAIVKEKCTAIYGTPTMYVDLINKVRELNFKVPPIDLVVTGGATCSPQLFSDILEFLNVRKAKTVYGLTEACGIVFQSLFHDTRDHILNTVGHLMDHFEAKVVDLQGNIVPFGTPGELCVRSTAMMLGYWDDEKKTKETLGDDGWLRTGDQFVLREDGYGKIVGRVKEIIIRGGENLFPREIEDYLNTHPKVLETHCVGVPDERMGEEICAYVRLKKEGETLTYEEVKEFCKGHLAHFKVPKYLRVVEEYPKTTSGKVQKFKLVEMFKDEMRKSG